MKKLLALALTLVLLLAALPALAESESLKLSYPGDSKITLDSGASLKGFNVTYEGPGTTVTVTVTDRGTKQVYSEGSYSVSNGGSFTFQMHQYGSFATTGKPRAMQVTLTTSAGYKKSTTVYQMSEKESGGVYLKQIRPTYYSNNTASSFGPHLRDLTPNLTGLWYMVTPLDLTKQGRQTYELVASNIYVIGEVYVDVAGDTVTISYYNYYAKYGGDTKTKSEFVTLYHKYDDISTLEPSQIGYQFMFNRPISISQDLGGDTTVLMLVINHVDYCNFPTSEHMLRRFWENTPENKQKREALVQMIDWNGKNDPVVNVEAEPTVVPPAEG